MARRVMGSKRNATQRMSSAGTTPPADTSAQRILAIVRRIPAGRVSTYSAVAEAAGLPRRARLVGTVLRETPDDERVPWFRVINAAGRSSFPLGSEAHERQWARLEAEGVEIHRGRVDLVRYGWPDARFRVPSSLDEYLWKIDE